ncbi:hypothetical protein DNTS_028986, partial [Danionella cerebrum]
NDWSKYAKTLRCLLKHRKNQNDESTDGKKQDDWLNDAKKLGDESGPQQNNGLKNSRKENDGLKGVEHKNNELKDPRKQNNGLKVVKKQKNISSFTEKPNHKWKDGKTNDSSDDCRNWSEHQRDINKERRASSELCESEPKRFRCSWCAFMGRKAHLSDSTPSFSQPFRGIIEKHSLVLHQRVRWVVCEGNCGSGDMEKLWLGVNRAIRHHRLPTCNANFQRDLAEIWLYCDLLYCETIGNFLKQEFQLAGHITLNIHKLGDVMRL